VLLLQTKELLRGCIDRLLLVFICQLLIFGINFVLLGLYILDFVSDGLVVLLKLLHRQL
jgi:hypothetical protein